LSPLAARTGGSVGREKVDTTAAVKYDRRAGSTGIHSMNEEQSQPTPLVTVVAPCLNEAQSVEPLTEKLCRALTDLTGRDDGFEIIFVDDGSTDETPHNLQRVGSAREQVRVVTFRRNFGKAAALMAGFEAARAPLVVSIDSDLQDDPNAISELLAKLYDGYDVCSGWKVDRKDPLGKRLPSLLFNKTLALFSGIELHDYNCGLKAYRREAIEELHIYGELHRYIPVLLHYRGFRVTEIPVPHFPRKYGQSKYGFERFSRGFLDLLTVILLTRYASRPLHAFGGVGLVVAAAGFSVLVYLTVLKFSYGVALSERPLLSLGVLLVVVGVQFISTGLLGEMLAREHQEKLQPYVLDTDESSASERALKEIFGPRPQLEEAAGDQETDQTELTPGTVPHAAS
jgi:glycosyltransferase involved in cell wall biosynthesis